MVWTSLTGLSAKNAKGAAAAYSSLAESHFHSHEVAITCTRKAPTFDEKLTSWTAAIYWARLAQLKFV